MSPRPVLLVAIASLLLTSADADAQEASGPQGRWYGYQTLIFDGAAAVLFPVGLAVAFEEGGKSFPIRIHRRGPDARTGEPPLTF